MNPQSSEKYRQLYLQTAQQYLQTFEVNLDGYITKNYEQNALQQMFIAIHSIKSQSLVMGYTELGNYCKELEDLLKQAKDSGQPLTEAQIHTLQSAQQRITTEIGKVSIKIEPNHLDRSAEILPPEHSNGKKLLLVEDDQFFEKFYAYKLKESGYTIAVASNGQEGLQMMATFQPQLVLLDLIMPIKDGFQVLTEKAQMTDNNIKNIPTIVFSTLGQDEDIKRAMKLGAVDYVNKSFFDYEKLLSKITQQLG